MSSSQVKGVIDSVDADLRKNAVFQDVSSDTELDKDLEKKIKDKKVKSE